VAAGTEDWLDSVDRAAFLDESPVLESPVLESPVLESDSDSACVPVGVSVGVAVGAGASARLSVGVGVGGGVPAVGFGLFWPLPALLLDVDFLPLSEPAAAASPVVSAAGSCVESPAPLPEPLTPPVPLAPLAATFGVPVSASAL
jgi:hypothetical protein